MSILFPNHYNRPIYKHVNLPVFVTDEFDFYRCIPFEDGFYGKSVSELHQGNLRNGNRNNRYSELFPGRKVSYWADSPNTARAELKYHTETSNIITFFGYDDASSSFPTRKEREPLIIVDGRDKGFNIILEKFETGANLDSGEKQLLERIEEQNPDCLAYESLRRKGGFNFLFFDKGFEKLSLREVRLRIGENGRNNTNRICCAFGSDYTPIPEAYGFCFRPIARLGTIEGYISSEEYNGRKEISDRFVDAFMAPYREDVKIIMPSLQEE